MLQRVLNPLLQLIPIDIEDIVHLPNPSGRKSLLVDVDITIVGTSIGRVHIQKHCNPILAVVQHNAEEMDGHTRSLVRRDRRINHQGRRSLIPEREREVIVITEELRVGILHLSDLVDEFLGREFLVGDVAGNRDVREGRGECDLGGFGVDHEVDLSPCE